MNYVVGFFTSPDLAKVVLVRKQRPAWQAGKLNGVGGKIEIPSDPREDSPKEDIVWEAPKIAMAREFEEETGVLIDWRRWHCFDVENFFHPKERQTNKVYFFFCIGDEEELAKVKTMTDEEIVILDTQEIGDNPDKFIFNIPYLWIKIMIGLREKVLYSLNPEGVNFG
jgi:8-oxo-dGTP pyrophosphatase MutT (NUDIX family)